MHVVIAGYGRVGRSLAHELESRGHGVAVIDHDPMAFEEFDEIHGPRIAGEAFDRETLEAAGIAKAKCLLATTSGDNTNFVSARVARDLYGVETVIARIYGPRRAETYRGEGIATISTVEWATGQFLAGIPDVDAAEPSAPAADKTQAPAPLRSPDDRPHTVIVGGGKAGSYLAERLRKMHRITLVETRVDKCEHLRRALPDIEVLHGDGCEPRVLEQAGVRAATFVAAATGDDEDNLVVSHLVKSIGSAATVVARINHPDNEWLFTPAWGVDVPVGAAVGLYMAVAAAATRPAGPYGPLPPILDLLLPGLIAARRTWRGTVRAVLLRMVRHVGEDHAGQIEQRTLDPERRLVVQEELGARLGHELREDHRHDIVVRRAWKGADVVADRVDDLPVG